MQINDPFTALALLKSTTTLDLLQRYLVDVLGKSAKIKQIILGYDSKQDQDNLKDPRSFAYTTPGSLTVFVTAVLEDVDERVRTGVLLHEIAHIALHAFDGASSEVDVDSWILRAIPEAGYTYHDHKFFSSLSGHTVTAKNVEHVNRNFLDILHALKKPRRNIRHG